MFRTTIRADESTDVDAVVYDLRNRFERANVAPMVSEIIVAQVRDVLAPLVERGRQLAETGSQMSVMRDLAGDGVSVKLIVRANVRLPFFERLINVIRGR